MAGDGRAGLSRVVGWKAHLRIEARGDDLYVIADGAHHLFRGRGYAHLAALLDGERALAAVVTAAGPLAAEVLFAAHTLEARGYLAEVRGPAPFAADARAFWHGLGSDEHAVSERLRATPVAVDGDDDGVMTEALRGAGVVIDAQAPRRIALGSDLLTAPAPAEAAASASRWLPVRLDGLTGWIGPWLGAPGGPCRRCLDDALARNRPVEQWLGGVMGPRGSLPASRRALANLAALTVAWWIADGGVGAIDDHLLAFSLTELAATRHRVVRRPQCPACGDPTWMRAQLARPIALAARPRRPDADGGYRTVTPEETVARLAHLISPITGAIASLGPVPGRDHPMRPVMGAVYRVTPPAAVAAPGFDDFHKLSSGKGRTPAQARASALCEALERLSAIAAGDEPIVRAARADLDGAAVDPDQLQRFSAAQFAARDPDARGKHRVPRPYRDGEPLDWVPAWSLTHDRRVYLPADYCFAHRGDDRDAACVFNPNGHAAGNCLEEAILQGFLELAERDAIAIWWYARLRVPGVDLDGFGDPYFAALREHYRELGAPLRVLDLTTDLGLPTFVAIAGGARPAIGFGCHLDAGLGVQRALTELNQIWSPDPSLPAPWDPRALADDGFLHSDPALAPRTARDYPAAASADLRDDVLACVARAAALGLDTLVIDQTRPELGLSAAKVVVPGLRHFWPRFGPGRLYDVPAARGVTLTEAELNPVPLLL